MGFLPPREVYHPVVDIYIPVYEERVSYFPFRFRRSKCNRVVLSYWVFHSSLCRIQWSSPRLGHYEQSFKANNKRSTRFDDPLRHNPERKRGTEEAFKQNFVRTSGEGSADWRPRKAKIWHGGSADGIALQRQEIGGRGSPSLSSQEQRNGGEDTFYNSSSDEASHHQRGSG